jgi:hypothetical protein
MLSLTFTLYRKYRSMGLGVMVFNATFKNISSISWSYVLLVKETGVPGDNDRPATSHWKTLSHNVASSTPRLCGIWTHSVNGDSALWVHHYIYIRQMETLIINISLMRLDLWLPCFESWCLWLPLFTYSFL